jgi:hypothetical protein
MESFHLIDLARASVAPTHSIAASAAAITLGNRHDKQSIDYQQLTVLEILGGRAALEALVDYPLDLDKGLDD